MEGIISVAGPRMSVVPSAASPRTLTPEGGGGDGGGGGDRGVVYMLRPLPCFLQLPGPALRQLPCRLRPV